MKLREARDKKLRVGSRARPAGLYVSAGVCVCVCERQRGGLWIGKEGLDLLTPRPTLIPCRPACAAHTHTHTHGVLRPAAAPPSPGDKEGNLSTGTRPPRKNPPARNERFCGPRVTGSLTRLHAVAKRNALASVGDQSKSHSLSSANQSCLARPLTPPQNGSVRLRGNGPRCLT